ncbi:Speckle-type POZ protein [Araneus ventricosus]|uniref:Speckle-type POZ protein n=1 Tax=Araneus ventricosus TaxID=182803 RepID=A0A4Y2QVF7_ARAVE|nr:Speckle-type POZ protein [Araneus ventricosus]
MNSGRKECSITWCIENFSYCWHNNGEKLISPKFTVDGLNGTTWSLQLYPRGESDNSRHNLSLYLGRCKTDNGPDLMPIKYQLSVLASDRSAMKSREIVYRFRRGVSFGTPKFLQMDEVFLRQNDFLTRDRLSVRCIMWSGEGNAQSVTQFRAVSRIGIEEIYFLHVVEGFSALKPNEEKTIQINSPSGDEPLSSSVYFSDDSCCKGKIMVEIAPSSTDKTLAKCKLSILDGSGKLIECIAVDNRFKCIREDIKKLSLPVTRTIMLNRKSEYLPDDKLSLLCDCTFATKIEFEKIEKTLHELPLVTINLIRNNNRYKITYNAAGKLTACSSALDDFKTIYNDLFLSDIELKTETKSFPAHKIVLCARSSVFKAMLSSDMKEKITDCIQVDDLENDTVQQLLLFLYSDNLQNLQWESAIKLYYAGDKYNIEKLKVLCSSFLLDNLSSSNAIDLLLLADKHNDSDLRKFIENFILEHEEEVFGSDEWEKLMEINPQLVSRTMHLKYKRKRGGK